MILAGILAGGVGSRMGGINTPKQFLKLGNKAILIHTLEKFSLVNRFDKIYVGVLRDYIPHTCDLIEKHLGTDHNIVVVEGGTDRNSTISNIIAEAKKDGATQDSVLVTHDAVRPFLSTRIIEDNIDAALKYGVCDTAIPASDTIIRSADDKFISEIPLRKELFQGQTPQSFKVGIFEEDYGALSDENKVILTDACKIFVLAGRDVYIVLGETYNIKVTSSFDLKLASAVLAQGEKYD